MTATTIITVRGDFSSERRCSAGIMIPATPPLDSLFALRPLSYCTCSADVNHGPRRKPGASFRINQVSDDCWLNTWDEIYRGLRGVSPLFRIVGYERESRLLRIHHADPNS